MSKAYEAAIIVFPRAEELDFIGVCRQKAHDGKHQLADELSHLKQAPAYSGVCFYES